MNSAACIAARRDGGSPVFRLAQLSALSAPLITESEAAILPSFCRFTSVGVA
jgi:hypothetical protein